MVAGPAKKIEGAGGGAPQGTTSPVPETELLPSLFGQVGLRLWVCNLEQRARKCKGYYQMHNGGEVRRIF